MILQLDTGVTSLIGSNKLSHICIVTPDWQNNNPDSLLCLVTYLHLGVHARAVLVFRVCNTISTHEIFLTCCLMNRDRRSVITVSCRLFRYLSLSLKDSAQLLLTSLRKSTTVAKGTWLFAARFCWDVKVAIFLKNYWKGSGISTFSVCPVLKNFKLKLFNILFKS